MKPERTIGGWVGCVSLIVVPVAYVIVDDDIVSHALSSSLPYSFLFLVVLPVVLFRVVKWTVNGIVGLGRSLKSIQD
jgi:hypothetical protein